MSVPREGIPAESVEVVGEQHDLAATPSRANGSGRVGQDHGADARPREGADRPHDRFERMSLVRVEAPGQNGDRDPRRAAHDELPRVPLDGRPRKAEAREREPARTRETPDERPRARAQHDPHARVADRNPGHVNLRSGWSAGT
jgi:hypothetical protein